MLNANPWYERSGSPQNPALDHYLVLADLPTPEAVPQDGPDHGAPQADDRNDACEETRGEKTYPAWAQNKELQGGEPGGEQRRREHRGTTPDDDHPGMERVQINRLARSRQGEGWGRASRGLAFTQLWLGGLTAAALVPHSSLPGSTDQPFPATAHAPTLLEEREQPLEPEPANE